MDSITSSDHSEQKNILAIKCLTGLRLCAIKLLFGEGTAASSRLELCNVWKCIASSDSSTRAWCGDIRLCLHCGPTSHQSLYSLDQNSFVLNTGSCVNRQRLKLSSAELKHS